LYYFNSVLLPEAGIFDVALNLSRDCFDDYSELHYSNSWLHTLKDYKEQKSQTPAMVLFGYFHAAMLYAKNQIRKEIPATAPSSVLRMPGLLSAKIK
jgi:hypothetical protein